MPKPERPRHVTDESGASGFLAMSAELTGVPNLDSKLSEEYLSLVGAKLERLSNLLAFVVR